LRADIFISFPPINGDGSERNFAAASSVWPSRMKDDDPVPGSWVDGQTLAGVLAL
jgi:hypothetical protein